MRKILSALLGIALLATAIIPLMTATVVAAEGDMELIYAEDFDNVTDASALGYNPNARGQSFASSQPATLEIVSKRLKVSQTTNTVAFIPIVPSVVMRTLKRFTVEMDLEIASTSGGVGLVYYWPEYLGTTSNGTNTYHTLQFRSNYTRFVHAGNVNGTWDSPDGQVPLQYLSEYDVQDIGLNKNHKIRVEANGSNVKAYIDGILLSEVNNAVYYESPLCLMVYNASVAYYDNIKVWGERDTSVYYPAYLDGQVIYREDFEGVTDVAQLGYDIAARHKVMNAAVNTYPTITIDDQNTKRLKIEIPSDSTDFYFYKFLPADTLRGLKKFTVQYDLQITNQVDPATGGFMGLGLYWPEHIASSGNTYFSFQFRNQYGSFVNSGRSSSSWFNYAATSLASKGISNVGLGTSHRLKVEVDGSTVKSYVDGILVDTKTNAVVYDSPLFFIMMYELEAYIDNIIVWAGNGVEPVDYFGYHGFSIRVEDPSGLRAKYSISKQLLDATIESDGYKVVEYGMILTQRESYDGTEGKAGAELLLADDLSERSNTTKVVIWQNGELKGNIHTRAADRDYYTAVLIGIQDRNLDKAYAFRAYCIIEDAQGNQTALYGMTKERSIYDVAKLVLADPDNGLSGDQLAYVLGIVNLVEADE